MNPESNEALSRRVAEAAGWRQHPRSTAMMFHESRPNYWVPMDELRSGRLAYATSLDAIKRLEDEAGYKVDISWSAEGVCRAMVYSWLDLIAEATDTTEPRARCRAYLAATAAEGGKDVA